MERDILSGVIEVEKEIKERLKNEEKKSQEWLENVKRYVNGKTLLNQLSKAQLNGK